MMETDQSIQQTMTFQAFETTEEGALSKRLVYLKH